MNNQNLIKLHSNHSEQVNNLKCLVKWIEIQKASFKFSRTSEQGEQSEQTQIVSQMKWDSESFIQIFENKWTSEQRQILSQMKWDPESFIQILENK